MSSYSASNSASVVGDLAAIMRPDLDWQVCMPKIMRELPVSDPANGVFFIVVYDIAGLYRFPRSTRHLQYAAKAFNACAIFRCSLQHCKLHVLCHRLPGDDRPEQSEYYFCAIS